MVKKKTGWYKESKRHSLAAKGIKTVPKKVISGRTYYPGWGAKESFVDNPYTVDGIKQREIYDDPKDKERTGQPNAWIRDDSLDKKPSKMMGETKNRKWVFGSFEDEPKRAKGVAKELEKQGFQPEVKKDTFGGGGIVVHNVYVKRK